MSRVAPPDLPLEPLTPQRRRELTRSHLLAAAERTFKQHGFHGASIDAVAAAAGFTKGAVYSNFKNKEDLFIAVTEQRWNHQMTVVRDAMADAATLGPDDRTDLFSRLAAELLWADRDWQLLFLEFQVHAARHPAAQERIAERHRTDCAALAQVIDAELDRVGADPPIPPEDLAATLLAFFNGIALKHATNPESTDDTLLHAAITLLNAAFDALPPRPQPTDPHRH